MQVNEDGNSVIIKKEIYETSFPNMEYYQLVDCVKYTKYCSKHRYNIKKHNNPNVDVTMAKW